MDFITSVIRELIVALGLALVAGNAWALARERRERKLEEARAVRNKTGRAGSKRGKERPRVARGQAWFFIFVGAVMAVWGVASLTFQR